MEVLIDECYVENKIDRQVEGFRKKYRAQIEAYEAGAIIKQIRPVQAFDIYGLGKQLDSWDELVKTCEADGTVGDLGILPRIALDLITASFATSPIGIVSTIQPIDNICRLAA